MTFLLRFLAEKSLEVLQEEVKLSMKAAFAEGTSRNVKLQWRSYLLLCELTDSNQFQQLLTFCVYMRNFRAGPSDL